MNHPGVQPQFNNSSVPQFVTIGFDDNAISGFPGSGNKGGLQWILDLLAARNNPPGNNIKTYDGTPCRVTFFCASKFIESNEFDAPANTKAAWRQALEHGHEIGNHTHHHPDGSRFTLQQWRTEIETCTQWLTRPYNPGNRTGIGVDPSCLAGFRTPYLRYDDHTFTVLQQLGFLYDSSIYEGYQPTHDGANFNWPYPLDSGSPGDAAVAGFQGREPIGNHPGLWEVPIHPVIVPPDDLCPRYNLPPGLRKKMAARHISYQDGKIPGLDYNMLVEFQMTKPEFLGVLKYTFDLRYNGNRAPMVLGGHSDIYSDGYYHPIPNATYLERQTALQEFIDYVLSKPGVRIVSIRQILDWIQNPVPLT
jgi:peptidoglycan/xylan/chitin deacetylase (PgdA/CDA1 family)